MITRLCFYDFDGTLFNTPHPELGRIEWKNKTGQDYPHTGWWGKSETLNMEIFDIKPNDSVLNKLENDNQRSDTYTVLLTSRIERLKPDIENVLKNYGIFLNELNLKKNNLEKDERILEYINKFPNIKDIDIYDDREKELIIFKNFKEKYRDKFNVNIYMVNNNKIDLIESKFRISSIIIEEINSILKQ